MELETVLGLLFIVVMLLGVTFHGLGNLFFGNNSDEQCIGLVETGLALVFLVGVMFTMTL